MNDIFSFMSDLSKLSKQISYILRHAPWEYELELDDEGWVTVDQLLAALNSARPTPPVTPSLIHEMIKRSDKQRYEIVEDRIRALYGHSLPGKLKRSRGTPPEILYHGTSLKRIPSIETTGLLPMARQYVHLSTDQETAQLVGARKGKQVVILSVRARAAAADGVAFYEGNSQVWLADEVPARWIEFNQHPAI